MNEDEWGNFIQFPTKKNQGVSKGTISWCQEVFCINWEMVFASWWWFQAQNTEGLRCMAVYGLIAQIPAFEILSPSLSMLAYIYIFFMNYVYIYIFADLELKLLQNASFFVWQLPFGLVHTSACHIQFFPCVSCRLNWEGIIFTANNCIAITCGNRFLEMYENYGPPEDVCCWKGNNKFLQLQIFMSPFLILEGESHTVPTSDLKYSLDEPPRVPPKNHTRPSWT